MAHRGEDIKQEHGEIQILAVPPPSRQQRPLTSAEKMAATKIEVQSRTSTPSQHSPRNSNDDAPAKPGSKNVFTKLRELEAMLDQKLGIESEAIVRKRPEERQPVSWHSQLNMALLWASGAMNLSCFATGFLGWQFGLTLAQSILITIFASILGGAVAGFCATMGAPTGLRQISVSRYSMGWYPNKLIAVLNVIQQLGWSASGCITGGLALQAVSDGRVSIVVGIIIIAVVSLCISFFGLRVILVYEKYAWFVFLVIFLIILGETGRFASPSTPAQYSGSTLSGNLLTLIAIVYGSSASWATIASDYYVHYPANVSRTKVFLMTTFGIAIPTSIGMVAGCVVSSALNTRPDWLEIYNTQGFGFLIQTVLYPRGFAKFLLVLLVLSGINLNILNLYSASLSCQQFARPFALIPRVIWTFLCFGIIVALSLAGRDHLLTYLQNFLSLLGYWCTSYFVIVFTEHVVFRKRDFWRYDLEGWNDPKRLPLGLAAAAAFGLGIVAWIMGMVQSWFTGPLGGLIGSMGGDVANQFTFVVTLAVFIPARYMEYKYIGR